MNGGERVYRVSQELTLAGLKPWQLMLIACGFFAGLMVQPPSTPWLSLILALAGAFLVAPPVLWLGARFKGEALPRYLAWLILQAKHYCPGPDLEDRPLVALEWNYAHSPTASAQLGTPEPT